MDDFVLTEPGPVIDAVVGDILVVTDPFDDDEDTGIQFIPIRGVLWDMIRIPVEGYYDRREHLWVSTEELDRLFGDAWHIEQR